MRYPLLKAIFHPSLRACYDLIKEKTMTDNASDQRLTSVTRRLPSVLPHSLVKRSVVMSCQLKYIYIFVSLFGAKCTLNLASNIVS